MTAAAPSVEIAADEHSGTAPERRCIVTGKVRPKDELIRFVLRPAETDAAGEIVPDLEARLPGRGLWITAERDIVARAVAKNLFSRAARGAVTVAPDLADRLEALLVRRCVDHLGLARRAGQAVAGFEQVRSWVERGRAGVLVEACDGSPEGRRKAQAGAGNLPVVAVLSGQELGAAFGREWFGHVALAAGRIAQGLCREAARLAGFRGAAGAENRNRLTDR